MKKLLKNFEIKNTEKTKKENSKKVLESKNVEKQIESDIKLKEDRKGNRYNQKPDENKMELCRFTSVKERIKGVTLISLVVTIVVLIILAGISIAILSGDNGILKSAQRAQETSKLADIREEVDIKWVEVLKEAGPTNTIEELEQRLQDKLRQEDKDAVVKYNPANDTFEITYKDMMLEIQNNDTVTVKREEWKDNIEDIFNNIDPDLSLEDKADKIEEELKKDDPNSSAEYNPDTGEIDISHGDYTGSVDEDGNVEVKDPIVTQHPSINITSEPSDVSIIEEGTATFSVSAITRGDVTYQWYQNTVESDTTGTAIDNANSSSYTTEVLNKDSRNIYFYCEITATLNGETVTKKTRVAKANIFGKVEIAGDENTEKVVLEGEDASFEITASGEGELSYQWYKNSENSSSGGTPISGAVNPTYTIEDAKIEDDNTYYYCVVTQKKDGATASVSSNPIKLTVLKNLNITKEPSNAETIVGNEVTFTVEAEGAGELRYEWYRNTSNSTEGGTPIPGANTSTYTIPAEEVTTGLNGSYYYCKITQVYNEQEIKTVNTKVVSLSVIEKTGINVQPTDQGALEGNTAVFDVEVRGEGDIKYQWYKTTENSSSGGEAISNATSSSYTIKSASTDMNGTYYYCIVTQKYGTPNQVSHEVTSEVAQLTIGTKVSVSRPTSVNTIENTKDVTFTVKATGEGTFKYQWYKNTSNSNTGGSAISGANSATYTIPKANVTTSLNNTYYYCVVTQTYGSSTKTATSGTAQLTVIAGVTIKTQPTAQSVYESKPASFTVEVNGGGTITYQWYSNSSNSTSGGSPISGQTNATYTIPSATSDLNGKYYYCIVTQKYGSPTTATATVTTTPVKLTVTTTTITANPTSITVYVGGANGTVTLSGTNAGTFSISSGPNSTYATASISGNKITITGKSAGSTTLKAKEANGDKEITIQ